MKGRFTLWLFLFAFVLTTGCRRAAPPARPATKPALYVETTQPEWMLTRDHLRVQGEVIAEKVADVGAEVSGQVRRVAVREGDRVGQGAVLVKIDEEELQVRLATVEQQIRQAQANLALVKKGARSEEIRQLQENVKGAAAALELAQKNEDRLRRLHGEGAVSLSELDAAKSQREQAQAQLASAREALSLLEQGARAEEIEIQKAQLRQTELEAKDLRRKVAKTSVRAPFSGVVERVLAQRGEVVSPGTPLVRLVGAPVYFEAGVPQKRRRDVREGMEVVLRKGNLRHVGRVERVLPVVEAQSRTFGVRVPVPFDLFPPGSYAEGEIVLGEAKRLVIPPKSVKLEGERTYAFVVEGGKVAKRQVQGKWVEEGFALLWGLAPLDQVVTTLSTYLADGAKVEVVGAGE